MNTTILICDDNPAIHESLSRFLAEEGFRILSAYSGEEAFRQLRDHPVDLLILDIMLPGIDGTEVCHQIRMDSSLPILFLSAKAEEYDRIRGLEIGGDDYVTKPFSPREVTLRVKKMLEKSGHSEPPAMISYGELTISESTQTAFLQGTALDLTAKEIALLLYFIRNAGRVLNREQILHGVWGFSYDGDVRAVDAAIKRIRKKFSAFQPSFSIQSVYGVGYRLKYN